MEIRSEIRGGLTHMRRTWNLRRLERELCHRLSGKPARRSADQAESFQYGDFFIDLGARTVRLQAHELHLSAEEFDVLLFLAEHPKRIVTSRTVLRTTWNADDARQTEFLRVLLSLHKKLEEVSAGKHYLQTEPWVAYKFSLTAASAA